MPDPVWGAEGDPAPEPSGVEPPSARRVEPVRQPKRREPEPLPDWLKSSTTDVEPPPGRDPVAVVAVTAGFVGIVVLGLLMAVVAGVLGSWAGQRARESGRTFELPYLALGLAFVDGVVWFALHLLLDVPFWIG